MAGDGPVDLRAQLRRHLESLQAAGVLFVPGTLRAPLNVAPVPRVAAPVLQPEVPVDPRDSRRQELQLLAEEVAKCDKCRELFSTRTQTVFGTGPIDAALAFVGAAPGSDEEAQGEPFAGKAGELLSRIIGACHLTRDAVYLFNLIKCRPPKNRIPTDAECANCREFFDKQFDLVKPKHLVALGEFASRVLIGNRKGKLRGAVHDYRGVPLICTHHPLDILKDASGAKRTETGYDLKLLLEVMGREVPAPK